MLLNAFQLYYFVLPLARTIALHFGNCRKISAFFSLIYHHFVKIATVTAVSISIDEVHTLCMHICLCHPLCFKCFFSSFSLPILISEFFFSFFQFNFYLRYSMLYRKTRNTFYRTFEFSFQSFIIWLTLSKGFKC